MDITNYLRDVIGDHLLRNQSFTPPATVYLALFTTATDANGGGTEVAGGSYARQAITLAAFVDGASTNTAALNFTNMPAVTITHVALMSAVSGGNMLMQGDVAVPKAIASGGTATIAVGDLDVTFT